MEEELAEIHTADVINTIEALEDNYMEDFLDMDEVSENDELEKVPDNYLEDTHISSTGLDELNEDLTNLKNKTKIILTTGATATWNKMAAYTRASKQGYKILAQMNEDASAAKLLPDKIYDKIFKETRN